MLEDCYKEKRNSQFSVFVVNRTTNARFRVVTSKSSERYRQPDTDINCQGGVANEGKEWGPWSSYHYRSLRAH